jgi:hypothetical protein
MTLQDLALAFIVCLSPALVAVGIGLCGIASVRVVLR